MAIGAVLIITFLLTWFLVRESPHVPAVMPRMPARVSLIDVFQLDLRRHSTFAWLVLSRFLFLLGTYTVGRFLLFFVADRIGLDSNRAAEEAGGLLAALTLITALAAPAMGWAADRLGRKPLMLIGAAISMVGAVSLSVAWNQMLILLFGGLMAIGSAAFTAANWALTADVAPRGEAARFFGLANFGTAGAAATAGLFGPLVDWGNSTVPGTGYTMLFVGAALAFAASAVAAWRIARSTTDAVAIGMKASG